MKPTNLLAVILLAAGLVTASAAAAGAASQKPISIERQGTPSPPAARLFPRRNRTIP